MSSPACHSHGPFSCAVQGPEEASFSACCAGALKPKHARNASLRHISGNGHPRYGDDRDVVILAELLSRACDLEGRAGCECPCTLEPEQIALAVTCLENTVRYP